MVTEGALLTGMPGVHEDHGHACKGCFVRHILSELEESPIGMAWALLASGLNPLSDPGQIFETESRSGALRSVHEPFGDGMVGILLKPGLFPFEQLEPPPRRPGVMGLQSFPAFGVTLSLPLDCLSRMHRAIRVHRKIDDAEVHTQDVLDADGLRLQNITNHGKVEHALDVHQINLTLAKGEQGALPGATLVGNRHAALQSPDGQLRIGAQTKDPVVVGLCRVAFEATAGLAVELVGIGHFRNASHDHLGTQPKAFFAGMVGQPVQGKLPKRLCLPGLARQPGTGTVRGRQRLQKRLMLSIGRVELEISHKFHGLKYRTYVVQEQLKSCCSYRATSRSSPWLKRGVSAKGKI